LPPLPIPGVWSTTEGPVTMTGDGVRYRGRYPRDEGQVEGVLEGRTLRGFWAESASDVRCEQQRLGTYYWGAIVWRFAPDGRSFEGTWDYCGNPARNGPWRGTR
jgi:hypothetical protein